MEEDDNGVIDGCEFFTNWKKIAQQLGSLQIECKIIGRMNDQLTVKSSMVNFLLENRVKENPFGKVIVGIYHNFAKAHNEILNNIKSRKSQILKYKHISIYLENNRINPQEISRDNFIELKEEEILTKIMEFSVPSVKYGENIVYHNFDFCEAFFLHALKRKFELETDTEKYNNVLYVG
jgi:hypothetical protein